MNFLNRLFHLDEKQTSLRKEIIGGLISFVAMCYVLPLIASNLSSGAGMDKQGVFVITALLTVVISLIMAFVGNYPIALSSAAGINAYVAFTISGSFPRWEQRMILLTVSGLIFLILSLTKVRKWIINAIPKDVKCIISASLGGFLLFVGLKGAGVIVSDGSTLVKLGNFADPAMMIAVMAIFVTIALFFTKVKFLRTMAIPFGILFAAISGLISSLIMTSTGAMKVLGGVGFYQFGQLNGQASTLPIAPWLVDNMKFADLAPIKNVVFFGLLRDGYTGQDFANDLGAVFSNPVSYVTIFSIIFVNLFNTTATYLTMDEKIGVFDEEGKINRYHRTILADSIGSAIAGPFGTTTVEPLAESNVGITTGARTGCSTVIVAVMFLLSAFIYPIFSIFTASSVTAPALAGIGLIILSSSLSQLSMKKMDIIIVSMVTIILSILCFSITNGIGFGLVTYCIIKVSQGKMKEVGIPVFIITGLFVVSFIAEAVVNALVVS